MSTRIAGMAWVTPLGSGVPEVWAQLLAGESARAETLSSPLSARTYPAFRVPASALAGLPPHPRLRRSSAISRFATLAGLGALADADVKLDAAGAERTAVIFAISNGGVIYTKRFYHDIVATGAQTASPLLFPETVFNAPASHLAAILGITGASYTLVGDGAVGILAIKMAEDLLLNGGVDRCLVVAAEEADWLLCDAYSKWRLLRAAPPLELFQARPTGMILSEGAGALLLTHDEGDVTIEQTHPGGDFHQQKEARHWVGRVIGELSAPSCELVVASANGTFIDQAEAEAIATHAPDATTYAPKAALGEGVAASALWQVIAAAHALRTQTLPATLRGGSKTPLHLSVRPEYDLHLRRAVVSTCGLNQQVAGLRLGL